MTAYFKTIPVRSVSDVSCLSSSQISDSELLHWKELVAKCMTEYRSSECNKPDNKKLVWIVSRRTAQNLQANNFSVPALPTIPEGSWDESERLIVQFFHFILDPVFYSKQLGIDSYFTFYLSVLFFLFFFFFKLAKTLVKHKGSSFLF